MRAFKFHWIESGKWQTTSCGAVVLANNAQEAIDIVLKKYESNIGADYVKYIKEYKNIEEMHAGQTVYYREG